MKKFPLLALFLLVLSACKLDPVRDVWEYYEDWRNENMRGWHSRRRAQMPTAHLTIRRWYRSLTATPMC